MPKHGKHQPSRDTRAQKLKQKVAQEDLQRMRVGEIENLQEQKAKKVQELEIRKEVKSSFEVLGVVGMMERVK